MDGYSVSYDPLVSNLNATTVQDAIDNLRITTSIKGFLSKGDDLNNVFEDGVYTFSSGVLNSPVQDISAQKYGTVIVIKNFSNSVTQYVILNNTSKRVIYSRQYNRNPASYSIDSWVGESGAWSTWVSGTLSERNFSEELYSKLSGISTITDDEINSLF